MRHQALLSNWRRGVVAVMLAIALLITGCQPKTQSQFSEAQRESNKPGVVAVSKEATQGSQFNKYFPKPGAGYERVYSQEKKGFAEAKLKKDGKELAMLSISDTSSLPAAAAKYQNSPEKINGFPAMTMGNTQTGVLVGKYQVKVLSRDPSFTKEEREKWISKFDLRGLSQLKG